MWILLIILIVVVLFGMGAGYLYNRNVQKKIAGGELKEAPPVITVDSECCGQHAVCEKESLLAAVSKKIEYYDDEELDRYKGRASNAYTDKEIEEFRDILYTMHLPDEVKDEVFLIVGERRFESVKN